MRKMGCQCLKCLLILAAFWPGMSFGQSDSAGTAFHIGANAHLGYIIPHRGGIEGLNERHTRFYEVYFERPTNGRQPWHVAYGYPSWGVGFYYLDLGNPTRLGDAATLFAYYKFPVFRGKRVGLKYQVGWGLGYVESPFDRTENFKNIAIGTKMNAVVAMQAELSVKLHPRVYLKSGIGFTHFSNGSYQKPNLGINMLTVLAGMAVHLGPLDDRVPEPATVKNIKRISFTVMSSGGLKETDVADQNKYLVFSGSFEAEKHLSYKRSLVLGLDLIYNPSHLPLLQEDNERPGSDLAIVQPGLKVMYHLKLGRYEIMMGTGVYLYTRYTGDGWLYHRIGSRYRLSDRLSANLTLKTHFARADHMEVGLAYHLKWRE